MTDDRWGPIPGASAPQGAGVRVCHKKGEVIGGCQRPGVLWPCRGSGQSSSDITASTMKMMTSHFAVDIVTPATPRAPSKAKTIASTKKRIARPTRPFTILFSPLQAPVQDRL